MVPKVDKAIDFDSDFVFLNSNFSDHFSAPNQTYYLSASNKRPFFFDEVGFRVPTLCGLKPSQKPVMPAIQEVFQEVAQLEMMERGKEYECPVAGVVEKGVKEVFLDRRSATEILDSGLSTGCGDYAIAFYHLMEARGYQVKYIEGVTLSFDSIITHSMGHTGVAVFDESRRQWILTDPTQQQVVVEDWNPEEKLYKDRYWIGYVGDLKNKPAHNFEELRVFYGKILSAVPYDTLRSHLIRELEQQGPDIVVTDVIVNFEFVIDPSFYSDEGKPFNPNVYRFIDLAKRLYEEAKEKGISMSKPVKVLIIPGKKDSGDAFYGYDGGRGCWVIEAGDQHSMASEDLLLHLQNYVLRQFLSQ